jgi:hypothetical protein
MTDHYLYDLGVLILGIVIGAFVSLLIQKRMKKEELNDTIKDMKNAFFLEIVQNLNTIDDYKGTFTESEGVQLLNIKASLLNSTFESAVKSGKFLLLSRTDRNELNVLYDMIEKSNFVGKQIMKFGFMVVPTEQKEYFKKIREVQVEKYNKQHQRIREKLEESFEVLHKGKDKGLKTQEEVKRELLDKE